MLRLKAFLFFYSIVLCLTAQTYTIPESIRPKYYFMPGDSVMPSEKPLPALTKVLKGWTYLPADSFLVEEADGYDSIRTLYEVKYSIRETGFFFLPCEVSNEAYRKFYSAKRLAANMPDTACWKHGSTYHEPFSLYYFQHPAYKNYPVCGVSFHQAQAYCQWLQDSLNQLLLKKKIPQRVEVSLPSADEWVCIYYQALKSQKIKTGNRSYLYYSMPGNNNRVISGRLESARLANLKINNWEDGMPTPCNGIIPIGGVYHIMGNMAEWTRTQAEGHLFNNKEYTYTVTGKLIPNVYENHTAVTLSQFMRGKQLQDLVVIKGGSWADEHYYLQPGAMYVQQKNKGSAKIGFRPVIRVVKP